jgi:hypothetical protein
MKFSEIKHKIKNLGDFKSLEEIKKAGLRIVRNTKTDDYWLIEEEFLKPVIKSPRECKSILIKPEDLKYKVLMVHKSKEELKGKKVLDYIKWGESQKFQKNPTCKQRKSWFQLITNPISFIKEPIFIRDRFAYYYSNQYCDAELYDIYIKGNYKPLMFLFVLNSTYTFLMIEIITRTVGGGGGPLKVQVYEAENIYIFKPNIISITNVLTNKLLNKSVNSIFTELGFDPDKPIREQEPNPLPDRKALDDIVFDTLGLTEEERKEVYWAVAELVQNRLKKAESV